MDTAHGNKSPPKIWANDQMWYHVPNEWKFLNRVHIGAARASHLDFVHKFSAMFRLRSYKIAGHFHDLAGRGTSGFS